MGEGHSKQEELQLITVRASQHRRGTVSEKEGQILYVQVHYQPYSDITFFTNPLYRNLSLFEPL